tara:strand:+ start:1512 stop:2144 length:633 start_codon:yes stop_codon:yes gene_type:complete
MKFRLIIVLLAVSFSTVCAQDFEGKITYKVTHESKMPNVSNEQIGMLMGASQDYYIKNNHYKTLSNGQYFQWQLYDASQNRLYSKMTVSDTLYWVDGSFEEGPLVSFKFLDNKEEVLGIECDVLEVVTETGKTTYYFNSKYSINAELFKDHKFGGWSFYVEKTKSLPLKTIVENAEYNVISIASRIERMELEDAFFILPEGLPLKRQLRF